MMFSELRAVFPHMNVAGNVRLRLEGPRRCEPGTGPPRRGGAGVGKAHGVRRSHRRASSPADNNSASRSRALSSSIQRFSCSTSLSRRSTRIYARRCRWKLREIQRKLNVTTIFRYPRPKRGFESLRPFGRDVGGAYSPARNAPGNLPSTV